MGQQIVLKNSYDYNVKTVINHLIHRLYKLYDINTSSIESWLNSAEFNTALTQIDTKCFNLCMKSKNTLLNKLQNISHYDTFIDDNLSWEKGKCGNVLMEYSNGYVKYCNCHKYLHKTQQKNEHGLEDTNVINDHVFTEKTGKEIIDEHIFKLRYNMYLNYTRLMIKDLHILFDKMIQEKFILLWVPEKHKTAVHDYLLTNPNDFREKSVKYDNNESEYIALYLHDKLSISDQSSIKLPFEFLYKN